MGGGVGGGDCSWPKVKRRRRGGGWLKVAISCLWRKMRRRKIEFSYLDWRCEARNKIKNKNKNKEKP